MKKRFFGRHYANRNLFWRLRVRTFLPIRRTFTGCLAMNRAFAWLKTRMGFRKGEK